MFYTFLEDTPAGRILVAGDETALREVRFLKENPARTTVPEDWIFEDRPLRIAIKQLQQYFSGKRRQFDVSIQPSGTDFQRRVWAALCRVPFGKTASYGEIARAIGQPSACRAVGAANGKNPIPIIVPCHRIIGSNGALVGFGGGLSVKEALLRHEGIAV